MNKARQALVALAALAATAGGVTLTAGAAEAAPAAPSIVAPQTIDIWNCFSRSVPNSWYWRAQGYHNGRWVWTGPVEWRRGLADRDCRVWEQSHNA
jgi:hypothetical protein